MEVLDDIISLRRDRQFAGRHARPRQEAGDADGEEEGGELVYHGQTLRPLSPENKP